MNEYDRNIVSLLSKLFTVFFEKHINILQLLQSPVTFPDCDRPSVLTAVKKGPVVMLEEKIKIDPYSHKLSRVKLANIC